VSSPANTQPWARRIDTEVCGSAGSGILVINERKTPWVVKQSPSKISSIVYSYNVFHDTAVAGGEVGYSILLVQGSVKYRPITWDVASVKQWVKFPTTSAPLVATNFQKVNAMDPGPDIPDFSCKGLPISFGYVTGNSTKDEADPGYRRDHIIDDLVITVNEEPCACMAAVAESVTCASGPSGPSGCYEVELGIVNYTGQAVTHVLITPPTGTASPNVVPLQIAANDTSKKKITVTYCPPAGVTTGAFRVTLVGMPGRCEICDQSVDFALPLCAPPACVWVAKYSAKCVVGAPPGTFDLSFGMKNLLDCTPGSSLYLLPKGGVKVSPSYFKGPFPTNPANPNFVGNIRVTGANSTVFCMDVILKCGNAANCCTKTMCFTLPECWSSPMPNPTPDTTPVQESP